MDFETHLGNNLELLALAVLGLGNGLLDTGDGLGVKVLQWHTKLAFVGSIEVSIKTRLNGYPPGRR